MGQFLLLLHENPTDFADVSPEEMQRILEDYVGWRESLARDGRMVGSNKLADEGGKSLVRDANGLQVADGPYTEAKEVIGGYFLIEADDYEHAAALAGTCPHLTHGRIEIRQVEQVSH